VFWSIKLMTRFCSALIICGLNCAALSAQTTKNSAPGGPGADAHWPNAAKVGFGTSNTLASKVWFTLSDGVMTEAFYPRLDVPNTQCLQLIACTKTGCQTEADDMIHEVRVVSPHAPSFQQINRAKDGVYSITKTYTSDPERSTILLHVNITGELEEVYVYFDPSLNNSGMHDTGISNSGALLAFDANVASALISSSGFLEMTNGYLGTSDGLQQLKKAGRIAEKYLQASRGNIVQVAKIRQPKTFTLALGFGGSTREALNNGRASLTRGFSRIRSRYEADWDFYLKSLRSVEGKYRRQFNMAAVVLKALEDKTYPGAMIASPSIPWGGGPNANNASISGYHAVWARDLYQVASAFMAMGDRKSANRALDYLLKIQQNRDGSFPQNSWVDGRPIGGGLQMDQVAFPIVLAYQLGRTDRQTWLKHVKPAADYLVRHGPATPQDRWEEESGYSPSSIAAEIAGLICAGRIAEINGDRLTAAGYLKTADDWTANVDRWTATSNGPFARGQYYLRISEKGIANEDAKIEINSGGGSHDQREIVDAGFLELVRLGIKSANDPGIQDSIKVIDQLLKVDTPFGPGWYRYNNDAYGERQDGKAYDGRSGKGRLWTLLTGERGEFEVARGNLGEARKMLSTLAGFANEGLMIPEQVWDTDGPANVRLGSGTGSATPLAWSMAQFIRLAINIQEKRNVETPDVVFARYARKRLSKSLAISPVFIRHRR
jgi:glucoamylase